MCGNVLWGVRCLIICDYFNYCSHFRCSLIFCQFNIKNAGKNRPNVQDKENLPAQHVVKIVPVQRP